MRSPAAKHRALEAAALLDALASALPGVAPAESIVPALLGWPRDNTEQALHELERKGRLLLREGKVYLASWPDAFRNAARAALERIDLERLDQDQPEPGLAQYFRLQGPQPESGLNALESLSELFNHLARQGLRPACDLLFPLYLDAMRRLPLRGLSQPCAARYVELCRRAFPMALCVAVPCGRLPSVLLRGRALAFCHGLHRAVLELDLLIGGTNVLGQSRHNDLRFHLRMERAYNELWNRGEQALLEQYAHVSGIYFFMEGKFQRAVDELARAPALPFWPDIWVSAHRALLSGMAAAFLGESGRAENLLRQALRGLPQPGYPNLVAMFRASLALVMLDHGKDELALERIDLALAGVDRRDDLAGWLLASQALSVYHYNQQRLYAAYSTLCNGLAEAEREGYARPLYLFPALLELLERLESAGLPPVPGYDAATELARCLHGPNALLRGAALRLEGQRLEAAGSEDEALKHYEQSLTLFRQIRAYDEAAKTRFVLARYYLQHNDRSRAAIYAAEAGLRLDSQTWPEEVAALLPSAHSGEPDLPVHPVTEMELLGAFLDPLQHREWKTPEAFREQLIRCSCQALGLKSGCLFRRGNEGKPEVSACVHLTGGEAGMPSALDLVEIALAGSPVLVVHPLLPGRSRELSTLCIPLPCRDQAWTLCHHGELPAWTAELLSEELLARIGKTLAWEMEQTLSRVASASALPSGPSSSSAPSLPPGSDAALSPLSGDAELLFQCPAMSEFLRRADLAAASEAAVLITGESGTGKELVARRIHARSGRGGAFVAVNLAGIPDELFENEMLGHEKGAFTGAQAQKHGLLELAHNGTLFLDELTETSPRVQAKLLRLLQERIFYRLGGVKPIHSEFRLVAATNQNLAEAVAKGAFREDLFYRISVIPLTVPPLRERRDDIALIARHYLRFFMQRYGVSLPDELDSAQRARLMAWHWPGNVRELKNRMERFVILRGCDDILEPGGLPAVSSLSSSSSLPCPPCPPASAPASSLEAALAALPRLPLAEVQQAYIRRILTECGGRIDGPDGAAALLGVSRASLYQRVKAWRDSC